MELGPEHIIYKTQDEFGELAVADNALLRTLYFGNRDKQSCMLLAQPHVLTLKYSQMMASLLMFERHPERLLVLGLGGGSLAKFFLHACPGTVIDAVERRSTVIRVAHDYFAVPEGHERLRIYHQDGECFVHEQMAESRYAMMFVDIFDITGPAAALSREAFLRACYHALSQRGILCINYWNRSEDEFERKFARLQALFPGRVLKLAVEKINSNVLVLVFRCRNMIMEVAELEPAARALQRGLGLPSLSHWRMLREQNAL